MSSGKLTLILSSMYGGKTSSLMRLLETLGYAMRCLYINHTADIRSDIPFSTHNKTLNIEHLSNNLNADMIKIGKLSDIPDEIISKYSVVCIDEIQFFSDLNNTVRRWVDILGIEIYAAGLSGDYKRNLFGQVHELFPFADEIKVLRDTLCAICSEKGKRTPALFTKRLNDTSGAQIEIGNDNYLPVCRFCYLN
jgi:thymidine kinase